MKHTQLIGSVLLAGCAATPEVTTHATLSSDTPVVPAPSESGDRASPPPVALPAERAASEDDWRFVVAPYAWLLSVDGFANIGGNESSIDEGFDDILDQLNFVFEGRFEAWKGEWGLLADITYAQLENDIELGPLEGETTTDLGLAFLGAMYRFVEQAYADGPGAVTVDGVAGIAYTSLEGELDFDMGPDVDGDEDWVDPILGMRARWAFNEKWGASLETIIGGFELFDGADLITMSTATVGRKVGESSHLYFGWRTLDIDYENDESGSDEFDMNVNMNGPIFGFEWGF